MYIVWSANSDSFISSFLIWMPLISFPCIIALARASNTMLNKSSKSRYPCLFTDLRGKILAFYHYVHCRLITYGLYYVEVCSLYTHFLESFYHKWMLNFVKSFFYTYWGDHFFSSLFPRKRTSFLFFLFFNIFTV